VFGHVPVQNVFGKAKGLPSPPGPWSVGYAQAVAQCDVVLLIQGKDGTRLAGQLAAALCKPVAALPGFGGSSEIEWKKQLALYRTLSKHNHSLEDIEDRLKNYKDPRFASGVKALCDTLTNDVAGPSHASHRLALFIGSSILLITAWLVGFAWNLHPKEETQAIASLGSLGLLKLSVLLWVSTLLGVILRAARRLVDRGSYSISLADLNRDILMGVLLAFGYLLICLAGAGIYKQDILELTPTDVTRIGILMSIAGFAVGAFLEEALDFVSERVLKKFRS